MNDISKYTWNEMELCESCHYKDEDPDICNYNGYPEQKPGTFDYFTGCGRYLRESKFKRMPEEEYKQLREGYKKLQEAAKEHIRNM